MASAGHVIVVGDVILDRYWFGAVNRISREAPVPIVEVKREELRAGGAANAAHNIAALEGNVTLIGAVGLDQAGEDLREVLETKKITPELYGTPNRKTIEKIRIVSQNQQMMRADFEQVEDGAAWQNFRDARAQASLASAKCLVLSDYGYGAVCNCLALIQAAHAAHVTVLVDPKGTDWAKYKGADLLTPNRPELAEVVGKWSSEEELEQKVTTLRKAHNFAAVLVTRSEDGMTLFNDKGRHHVPTQALEVYDVSGAGDTVIATIALMLAEGKPLVEAIEIANKAAGIVVGKFGTATCTRAELFGG